MTREKAIKILEEIIDEGWLISDFEKCTAIDACEMAIKALEQEPILDKIRAEVKELGVYYDNDSFSGNRDAMFKCNEVLQILYKYNAESEEEDGNDD